MGLLSEDFDWVDYKIEIYMGLDQFIDDPCEQHHDRVAKALRENCKRIHYTTCTRACIAICRDNRKRDAIAIMGPSDSRRTRRPMVNTWKCSKHTPTRMRGTWIVREFSNSLYINDKQKFFDSHEIYEIPEEIYEALLKQFEIK